MGLIHLYRLLKDYLIIFLGKRLPDSRYLFCTKTFTGAPWLPLPRLTGFHGSPGQPGTLWPVSSVLLHWVPFLHPLYSRNLLNYLVHSRPHSHLKKKNNSLLLCSQGFKGKSWTCITTCVSEPKGTAMYLLLICQQAILMAQYVWDTALSTFVRGDHVIEAVVSFLQVKSKNPTIFLTQVYPNNWILILKSKNIWKPFTD